jgi:hypothetical protein
MAYEVQPLLNLYLPFRPSEVATLLGQYNNVVRKIAEEALGYTTGIGNHAIRAVVLTAMKDVLSSCSLAASELAIKNEIRNHFQVD